LAGELLPEEEIRKGKSPLTEAVKRRTVSVVPVRLKRAGNAPYAEPLSERGASFTTSKEKLSLAARCKKNPAAAGQRGGGERG